MLLGLLLCVMAIQPFLIPRCNPALALVSLEPSIHQVRTVLFPSVCLTIARPRLTNLTALLLFNAMDDSRGLLQTDDNCVNMAFLLCYESVTFRISS